MRWFQTGDVRADVPLRLHNVDPALRFWPKVRKTDQCWIYEGHADRNGYGLFRLGKTHVIAHRFSYELINGPIEDGLEIDHLCKNRSCVRPDHLEAVTHLENMRRAYADKTHCIHGHLLSEENVWRQKTGARICKECSRKRVREHYQRKHEKN